MINRQVFSITHSPDRRVLLRRLLVLGLAAGTFPLAAMATARPRLRDLQRSLNCPGALLARQPLDAPGELLALNLSGYQPLDSDISLPIGSVGKAILGWVFMRVAQARALSLDTPVAQLLDGIDGLDGITLRMLGEHRSGLAEPIASSVFQRQIVASPQRHWSLLEVLQTALDQPRQGAPGERYAYSNANSTLLALVLEALSGQPLQALVQQTLANAGTPLASLRCPASLAWRASGIRAFRHAKPGWPIGYGKTFTDVSAFNPSWSGAGGDWSLNIHDLLKAARLLGASAPERSRWLPQARRNDQDYGFHWQRHGDLLGHLGDVPGFSAVLLYAPQTQTAFAAITNLSNASDGSNPAYRLLNAWREGAETL